MSSETPPTGNSQEQSALEQVERVTLGGRTFHIVGTAHVSQKSVELAEQVIREVKPQSVAIELCDSRYQSLKNPDRWKNMDIVSVIRKGKSYVLMAQILLASFQKKLGDQLHVKPGAEMLKAAEVAEEVGAKIVLADRDITVTLRRTWASLGLWSSLKLLWAMLMGAFSKQEIDIAEIERLKSADALDELMREFSDALPEVRVTLIDERDQYLADLIHSSPGENVVAVVGAGHVPGIKRWLGRQIDRAALEVVPPPSIYLRLVGWLIPATAIGLLIYGFFVGDSKTSIEMIWAWIAVTGVSAAIGPLICLAHPITIVTAFVVAPITTLHPLLASGWFAGLAEALIHKPRIADLQNLISDASEFSGLIRNRVVRILLVIGVTNLTGTIGAIWGIKVVASML